MSGIQSTELGYSTVQAVRPWLDGQTARFGRLSDQNLNMITHIYVPEVIMFSIVTFLGSL